MTGSNFFLRLFKNPARYQNLNRIRFFFRETRLRWFQFAASFFLTLTASIFEGVAIVALIPAIHGFLKGRFDSLPGENVFSPVIHFFSETGGLGQYAGGFFLILLIFTCLILKNIFAYLAALAASSHLKQFETSLRKAIYKRYLDFGKFFFDGKSTGSLYQILMGFSHILAEVLGEVHRFLWSFVAVLVYLALMFWISPLLTLMTLLILLPLYLVLQKLLCGIREIPEELTFQKMDLSRKISNSLACILLVKSCGSEVQEHTWFSGASDRIAKFEFGMDKKRRLAEPLQESLVVLTLLFLAVAMTFLIEYVPDHHSVAGFIVYFIILWRLASALRSFHRIQNVFAAAEGPMEDIEEALGHDDRFYVADGVKSFEKLKRGIEIRDLNFAFPDRKQKTLHSLNLNISKGTTLALVGCSGAGKTTLTQILMRFYEINTGAVFVDGVDLREYKIEMLRNRMVFVSYDEGLINASFRINLLYGLKKEVPSEEIEAVLKKTGLWDFVLSQPLGIHAEIGEKGILLPEVERFRLSLARAMLKDPDVLMVEELPSVFDAGTERSILASIREAIRGRTALVITRRLSVLRYVDRIAVMEHGRIVEEGSLDELLARQNNFFRMKEAGKIF